MVTEETIFREGANYSVSDPKGINFNQIILEQLQRTTKLMSQEFHGGFFNEVTKVVGTVPMTEKKYIQDSRESFKNAVNCLYDLVFQDFDKEAKKEEEQFKMELSKKIEEWNKSIAEGKLDEEEAKNKRTEYHRTLLRIITSFFLRNKYFGKVIGEE